MLDARTSPAPDSFGDTEPAFAFFIEKVLTQRRGQHADRGNELCVGGHDARHDRVESGWVESSRVESGELVVAIVEDPSQERR